MKVNSSSTPQNLIDTIPKRFKPIASFIRLQESEADLSTSRIGQELATNLLPKSVFARGVVDLCDNAFREVLETILIYLGPKFVGEKVFRKLYSKNLDKGLKEVVATPAAELLKNKTLDNKKLMPIKAAIAISGLAIPLAEYSLSYLKNLFTLKIFKQSDFNNIANLNKRKSKEEDSKQQQRVKESAKKHIKIAGGIYAACLGLSALLITKGKDSKALQSFSEAILAPGTKFFKTSKKAQTINRYFGLDFGAKEVKDKFGNVVKDSFGITKKKLAMSNGQLTSCVVIGGLGYFGAAKDRGKQDFKEVLYRFPLVGFYAITGCTLVEKGFKSLLKKNGKCKELFEAEAQHGKMPKLNELDEYAKKFAASKGTTAGVEFNKLFKQKSTLILAPFLFGIGFMGLFVAGCSRYFTQYRYNQDLKKQANQDSFSNI